ncbi:MAG: Tetratricopeptide repeat [Pseudomonadota bacterium]|jgi:tetratricopeptide (TPR) repeat protein
MRRSDSEAIEAAIEDDPDEAIRLCEALLDDDEEDADVWAYLAEAQLAAGRSRKALETLAQVVELDPEWIEAYTLRAEILMDQDKADAAAIELDVASDLDAEDPRVLRARALAAELAGAFEEADRLYAEAEDVDVLWPAPPRFERGAMAAALQSAIGKAVQVREMPAAGAGRLRMVERGKGGLVVYARNLERELDAGGALEDVVLLVEEALEDLGD